jgi:hypothetical protein
LHPPTRNPERHQAICKNLAALIDHQLRGEMSELDDAGTYFDMPKPHKVTGKTGVYYFLSTRNNNFSNRSQKFKIVVSKSVEQVQACGVTGCKIGVNTQNGMGSEPGNRAAAFESSDVQISVSEKTFDTPVSVQVKIIPDKSPLGGSSSDAIEITPGNLVAVPIPIPTELTFVGGGQTERRARAAHALKCRREAHLAPAPTCDRQRRAAHAAVCADEAGGRLVRASHALTEDATEEEIAAAAAAEAAEAEACQAAKCAEEAEAACAAQKEAEAAAAAATAAMRTGLWVKATREDTSTIHLRIMTPETGLLLGIRRKAVSILQRIPHVCIRIGRTNPATFVRLIGGTGEVADSFELADNNGNHAQDLIDGLLEIEIQVANIGAAGEERIRDRAARAAHLAAGTDHDPLDGELEDRTCSGEIFKATMQMDPDSGRAIDVVIPVAPAISYGALYRWPVNEVTKACFERGERCDEAKMKGRQSIDKTCSYGSCKFATKQLGGYYQVEAADNIGLIAGLTIGCVLIAGVFVASAYHFRSNPDQWLSFKQWPQQKYKTLKLSVSSEV